MRTLLIASLEPHAGKTGIAAALTQRLAYEGRRVLALRLGAAGDDRAAADARFFATLPDARGRGGAPLPADSAGPEIARLAEDGSAIVETPDGAEIAGLANALTASVIAVHRGAPAEDETLRLQNLALALGARFLGVVLTALPKSGVAPARTALDEAALPALAVLPEDRLLYAPTIGEIADLLHAHLLLGEAAEDNVIEELMIGPVSADPGQPYYTRRARKAVIARSDKTDSQLAAMQTDTDCLILTGGLNPSPYTLDRASNEEIALMVAPGDTQTTLRALEDVYGRSRFVSETKLERMSQLLHDELDFAPIGAALA
ncbi:MAG TPA: DRTGG domain-containing protein [Dehalococcoidia bacterium]|nr:DRTGG domain-containing protein [Dehalococcoidia bacterium]